MEFLKKFIDKKFIANWAFLVFVNLIVKPAYIFGIEVPLQNQLGAEVYGQYFAVLNLAILLTTFLDFGINNLNNREIAKQPNTLPSKYNIASSLKICLGFLYSIIVFVTAILLDFSSFQLQVLGIVCLNQVLVSYILFIRSNIGALQFFRLDSIISILDKLLLIIVMAIALSFQLPIFELLFTFVITQSIIYLLVILFSTYQLKQKLKTLYLFKFSVDKNAFWALIKQSLPLAAVVLLMGAYTRMDGVMLERLLPDNGEQAGIYAAAFRLLDAGNQLAILVSVILLPRFSAYLQQKINVKPLLLLSASLVVIGSCIISLGSYFLGFNIIHFLYVDATQTYVHVFQYLMIAFPAMCLVYVYGTLMLANNSMRALNIIAFSGFAINLVLNFWLIPLHGALGAVIATIATQYLVIVCEITYTHLRITQ